MHPLDPKNPFTLRLSGQPNASIRDDTGVLQPETQGVAGVDPRAQCAFHAVHGRVAHRGPHASEVRSVIRRSSRADRRGIAIVPKKRSAGTMKIPRCARDDNSLCREDGDPSLRSG